MVMEITVKIKVLNRKSHCVSEVHESSKQEVKEERNNFDISVCPTLSAYTLVLTVQLQLKCIW